MIADYKRLAYEPDSIYNASKKIATDRLRRMEYQKINPDVVNQGSLGYNVNDINHNAGIFEDYLVRILGAVKKLYYNIAIVSEKRPIRDSERGMGRKKGGATRRPRLRIVDEPAFQSPTGRRASTETAAGDDSEGEEEQASLAAESVLSNYGNTESVAFDALNNTIEPVYFGDNLSGYDEPSYSATSVYTFGEKPVENYIITLLVEISTLIQQANTYFNGKVKKHITMVSTDKVNDILELMKQIKREYDFVYNRDIQAYLNTQLPNGYELINDIRNKLDKLQIDVAVGTRSSTIVPVGQGEKMGAGRGFVPLASFARFRDVDRKYML